jgi:hypothetical protein
MKGVKGFRGEGFGISDFGFWKASPLELGLR